MKPARATRPRIGLALGSGSARGWAHIGVIRALADAGIEPDLVCGTSIGALVGAAFVGGELDRLDTWVRSLRLQTVVSFLDVSLNGGLIKGDKLIAFFRDQFVDRDFSELARPFGAVATDLQRGREVWLREGGVSDAVRASIALPGLLARRIIFSYCEGSTNGRCVTTGKLSSTGVCVGCWPIWPAPKSAFCAWARARSGASPRG